MKFTLKNVRLAFPNLFRRSEQFDNFGAQLIIEKGSANAKAIDNAINIAAKAKWGAKADSIVKQPSQATKSALSTAMPKPSTKVLKATWRCPLPTANTPPWWTKTAAL